MVELNWLVVVHLRKLYEPGQNRDVAAISTMFRVLLQQSVFGSKIWDLMEITAFGKILERL